MRTWPCAFASALGLLAMLPACNEAPLVRVEIHYEGFEPACVQLTAADSSGGGPQTVPVNTPPGSRKGDLVSAVFAQGGWGGELAVSVEAHEQDCGGAVVAGDRSNVTVHRGETVTLPLRLDGSDLDEDGFVVSPPGTDCDDALADVHPGAPELCNNRDDNCSGEMDEGFMVDSSCGGGCGTLQCDGDGGTFCAPGRAFYRDQDMDGYGRTADVKFACTAPGGYVAASGDCDDATPRVHPGLSEVCDDLDNNCVSGIDETFPSKGGSCTGPFLCPGQTSCALDGGTYCQLTGTGNGMHPDDDGDGAGAPIEICVPDGGPTATNTDDCDDGDPFTALGFPEICDRRDNDCDGQVDNDGGSSVCPANPSWVAHAAGGGGHAWRSIWSWTDGGAWVVAAAQRHRVHEPNDPYGAATAWTSFDGDCPNGELTGVWADPATGKSFVVGSPGIYCGHGVTGSQDNQSSMPVRLGDPWAVVGFRSGSTLQLFVAGRDGGTLRWFGDGGAQVMDSLDGVRLNDIHGSSSTELFTVGTAPGTPPAPKVFHFSPPSSWTETPLPGGQSGSVEAVYSVSPRLAYAVTDGGQVLRWDGTAWATHPGPEDAGALRGVLAFGSSSVFVIDHRSAWEWNGTAWTQLFDAGTGTLVDLHGTNPADIWIARDPQMVYRWPQ